MKDFKEAFLKAKAEFENSEKVTIPKIILEKVVELHTETLSRLVLLNDMLEMLAEGGPKKEPTDKKPTTTVDGNFKI